MFFCWLDSESTTEEELIDAFSAAGTVTEFRFFPWVINSLYCLDCFLSLFSSNKSSLKHHWVIKSHHVFSVLSFFFLPCNTNLLHYSEKNIWYCYDNSRRFMCWDTVIIVQCHTSHCIVQGSLYMNFSFIFNCGKMLCMFYLQSSIL